MPLALDPQQTFEIVLESDREKPPVTRPTFVFRYLTGRQWKDIMRLQDAIDGATSGVEAIDSIYSALASSLVSWRNMTGPDGVDIPFDPAELDRILGLHEVHELFFAMAEQQKQTGDELKKSGSQSPSDSASYAKDVVAEVIATGPEKPDPPIAES